MILRASPQNVSPDRLSQPYDMAYVSDMTQPPTTEYLTLAQYAKALGMSTRTLQRRLDSGAITSDLKLPGPTGPHLFKADRVETDKAVS